jgi:TrmH family RNA methyltransferase
MNLSDIKKLHQKKYRQKFNQILIEGEHLVLELANTNIPFELLLSEETTFSLKNEKTRILSEKQVKNISQVENSQGIFALISLDFAEKIEKKKKIIFLEKIQDPGNLGTIIRSAAWFGNFEIWISENSVDPFNEKVVRSSMGAIFHVPIRLNKKIEELPNKKTAFLDLEGKNIKNNEFKEIDVLIFGNEGRGLSEKIKKNTNFYPFSIKGEKNIESLNLANAVSIALYEMSR